MANSKNTSVLEKQKVLVLEGKDDKDVFEALLIHMGIEEVDIRTVGGKDNFRNMLPALVKMHGFSNVKTFAIVRDADDRADSAFQSISNTLAKLRVKGQPLTVPTKMNQFAEGEPNVSIFIMPGQAENGMLEDLCLKTVGDDPKLACVDTFLDCISQYADTPTDSSKPKARAQVYLAARKNPLHSVGLGAKYSVWDFDSDFIFSVSTPVSLAIVAKFIK